MRAVILTGNKYPLGDAGAIRQHATAKILQKLGYEVLVLGYGEPTGKKVCSYEGVSYISFRPRSSNIGTRMIARYFFINRASRYIRNNVKDIDVLVVIDVIPKDFRKVKQIAQDYHAKLVHDSVEWYSPEEFPGGEKNLSYRNKEYTNLVAVGKGWRVIAISKFLEEHFKKRCDRVIRVPVIVDIYSITPSYIASNKKNVFVYAGAPGKKDYLATIIKAFSMLSQGIRNQVELHIVGVNKEQLVSLCKVEKQLLDDLEDVVVAHGRVPHNDAVVYVKNANYTILIRDETLRYAKAGFPTKVVESMAYGTPVLCNLSSDLQDYLIDQNNSVIARGHEPEDVYQAILSAIRIDVDVYKKMRENARRTAEKFFDYRNYIGAFSQLLK